MKSFLAFQSKAKALLLSLLLIFHSWTPVFGGAFEDMKGGARSIAMGSAYTASGDDLNTLHFNPAGLALIKGTELTTGYGRLHLGLTDRSQISNSFFAVGQSIKKGRFGTVALGYSATDLTDYYREDLIHLAYAKEWTRWFKMGLAFKRFQRSIESDPYVAIDPIFQNFGLSVSAYGLDYGLLLQPNKKYSFAFAMKDVNRPDIGLATQDRLPVEYRFGAAYKNKVAQYAFDFVKKDQDSDFNVGAERWFLQYYALRAGFDFGSREKRILSTGLGYRFKVFQMDYSFVLPLSGIRDSQGSHSFALTLRFGRPKERASYPPLAPRLERPEKKIKEKPKSLKELDIIETQPRDLLQVKPGESEEILNALYLFAEGDYPKGIKVLQKYVKKNPRNLRAKKLLDSAMVTQKELVKEYYYKGLAAYTAGDSETALRYWKSALKMDPAGSKAMLRKIANIVDRFNQKTKTHPLPLSPEGP